MKFYTVLLWLIFSWIKLSAQFSDNFTDNNFSTNPTWIGDTDSFEIDNGRLHLNAPSNTSESCLITQSEAILNAEWSFEVELGFNPSASNKVRVYLCADSVNLKTPLNGYYVEIGSADDDFKLFKQTSNTRSLLIDGADNRLDNTSSLSAVRVTRDLLGNWTLFTDTSNTGNYQNEGSAFDNEHTNAQFFGVLCDYTSTRSDKFWFDNFEVTGLPFSDVFAPAVIDFNIKQKKIIELVFSETIRQTAVTNFQLNGNLQPLYIETINPSTIHLHFENKFTPNTVLNLQILNIADTLNNTLDTLLQIEYLDVYEQNELIITEILPDEIPSRGLPETEYFELFNNTNKTLYLSNFMLVDLSDTTWLPNDSILAKEYVVVTSVNDTARFQLRTIGLENWLSLGNNEDQLTLFDKWGNLIHQVAYSKDWYKGKFSDDGTLLSDGGVSLEMIDLNNPCAGSDNWLPSESSIGGTPGQENSVINNNEDVTPPDLYRVSYIDSLHLLLHFSEAVELSSINLDFTSGIKTLSFFENKLSKVLVEFDDIIPQKGNINLQTNDCFGNSIGQFSEASYHKPSNPDYSEIIINELLFNPKTDGYDFIELYNRSQHSIDLTGFLFQELGQDSIIDVVEITEPYTQILPDQYFVFTENRQALNQQYLIENPGWIIETAIPNLPDDEGVIRFGQTLSRTFDSLYYLDDWHFELLNDDEGVSLERISSEIETHNADNWHSASSAVGFATPTYRNSQDYTTSANLNEQFTVEPEVISPNNDGYKDFTIISYNGSEPGKTASISIHNIQGEAIKQITQNELLGNSANWQWNGLDRNNQKVNVGIYIILIELTDITGNTSKVKKKIVVGTQF